MLGGITCKALVFLGLTQLITALPPGQEILRGDGLDPGDVVDK